MNQPKQPYRAQRVRPGLEKLGSLDRELQDRVPGVVTETSQLKGDVRDLAVEALTISLRFSEGDPSAVEALVTSIDEVM